MREFGQQLSTIWLPIQKTQCFHGESSNGRLGDSAKNSNEINEAIWLASAEKGQVPLSFVQRLPPSQVGA